MLKLYLRALMAEDFIVEDESKIARFLGELRHEGYEVR